MAFKFDSGQQGFKVVERTDEKGDGTGLLLLQIYHPTKLTNEQIIQFYHHGMIDYLEIKLDRKTEDLLNQLGEKFILIAGNMAIRSTTSIIGCKIISSFPYTDAYTYRPARKRIFIEHKSRIGLQNHLQTSMTTTNIEFSTLPWLSHSDEKSPNNFTQFIKKYQETPELPDYYPWRNYHLVGEGHYIQIYTKPVWRMLLPFAGEGDTLQLQHIINLEDEEDNDLEDCSSPQSIDSTHRDF